MIETKLIEKRLLQKPSRGRKPIVSKEKTVAFILTEKMLVSSYRKMELEGDAYLPHKYDHSSYQYQYSTLHESVLSKVIKLFDKLCKQLLNEIYFHILDSTGLSTSVRVPRLKQGTRVKTKLTSKVHTMLGYDPPNQVVIIESTISSDNHLSDGKGGEMMIKESPQKGYLFGDSAYETYALTELAEQMGLIPILKPTKKDVRKKFSVKARLRIIWNGNNSRLYKQLRGIGEVVYGGATRAGLIHTNSKIDENRKKDGLIISIRQNIFTYLRLKALNDLFDKLYKFTNIKKHFIYK